ncbi:MAG: proteasome accessory factor PafA2 family protein, partial [Candidatus Saccharibacteria bacterium]
LGTHLATHNIYGGAGAIVRTHNQAKYVIGQKVLNLNCDFATSSHGNNSSPQPLISLRDEELADSQEYSRVHITSIDANMSPWATWMKLGTTSVVLRMMELGYLKNDDLQFEEDMHQVAKDVAYDTTLFNMIRRDDGKTITAIEVQESLLLRAQKMTSIEGLPDEEMKILDEWERALVDLREDPELLSDRSDWIAKLKVIKLYMARHAIESFDDEMVIKKDRQWSHIGPLGIGEKLRKGRWAKWMPTEDEIEKLRLFPPQNTRAATRGKFIRELMLNEDLVFAASWNKIKIQSTSRNIIMNDPYSLNFRTETIASAEEDDFYDEESM